METSNLKNPLYITIVIYVILIGLILYFRPNFLYINNTNNSKRLKVFGTGSKSNKTIFPLWLILFISMVIVYSFLCVLLK
jgi:hypothetical protein